VLFVLGAGLGAVVAVGAWGVGDVPPATFASLLAWLGLLGVGLGGVALRAGAWAAADGDGTRVVVGMAGAALGSFVAIGVLGIEGALAVAAAGASATAALAAPARALQEEVA
jgi:hypothetical protein